MKTMKWRLPPKIKICEALGCIADGRIEAGGNEGKCFSSSGKKSYSVKYDGKNAIMSNDNGSYWAGYLGYPSIAFLLLKGKIKYSPKIAEALKGIAWKDINVKFKNDYGKTEAFILKMAEERGVGAAGMRSEIENIFGQIKKLDMKMLGKKIKPPSGY